MTISHMDMPDFHIKFDPHILSKYTFSFRYNSEHLLKIGNFLLKKINRDEFHKFPATVMKFKHQHKKFMELYGRAKIKEREVEGKAFIKANAIFYRPRFANRDDQRLFERLYDRTKTYK